MKNKIISILFVFVFANNLSAICAEEQNYNFADIIKDLCWDCMFPLKIAGVQTMSGPLQNQPIMSGDNQAVCYCPAPPPVFERVGVSVGYFEPSRMAEVVSDPFCSPFFNMEFGNSDGELGGTSGVKTLTKGQAKTFAQVHWWTFPIYQIMGWIMDGVCAEGGDIDMAFATEYDPLWQDDNLNTYLHADAILYANPVTNLACIADSIAASVANYPLEPLFWCQGSWGNVFPLTGNTHTKSTVEDAASILGSFIFMGHRTTLIWNQFGPGMMLCGKWPSPIWFKNAYRFQLTYPVADATAVTIGRSDLIWGAGKNQAQNPDNYGFVIFKKRECCAF